MPPTSRRGKGGDAGGSRSGARKRRQLTPESRPTPSPTMITRSRATEQSLSPQVGKQRASGSRATDKSRGDEKSAKRTKVTDAGSQEDAAAAASTATEEGSDAAIQEDAGAASASAPTEQGSSVASQEDAAAASSSAAQQASSGTSSPLRCPIMPAVIKSQDSNKVIYEPFDSAVVKAYMEEDEKYLQN